MNIDDILGELGKTMGVNGLKLGENGGCTLVFDGKLDINVELSKDKRQVHLYSTISTIPADGREAFYEFILKAHTFGYATRDAYFGIVPELNEVILFKNFVLEHVDYQDFVTGLESFVNIYEGLTEKIQKGEDAQSENSPIGNETVIPTSSGGDFIRA